MLLYVPIGQGEGLAVALVQKNPLGQMLAFSPSSGVGEEAPLRQK